MTVLKSPIKPPFPARVRLSMACLLCYLTIPVLIIVHTYRIRRSASATAASIQIEPSHTKRIARTQPGGSDALKPVATTRRIPKWMIDSSSPAPSRPMPRAAPDINGGQGAEFPVPSARTMSVADWVTGDDPDTGEAMYEDVGRAKEFRRLANKHFEELEWELGTKNPKPLYEAIVHVVGESDLPKGK